MTDTFLLNSWLKKNLFDGKITYDEMNAQTALAPIGSDGLIVLPFGNGAERMLYNRDIGSSFHGLNLVKHQQSHLCLAL